VTSILRIPPVTDVAANNEAWRLREVTMLAWADALSSRRPAAVFGLSVALAGAAAVQRTTAWSLTDAVYCVLDHRGRTPLERAVEDALRVFR
jgi:hypothetical protein